MERLTWMLTRMLRDAARLLPPGRQARAEAVQAEADLGPAGWPRVGRPSGRPSLAPKVGATTHAAAVWAWGWAGCEWSGPVGGSAMPARCGLFAGCPAGGSSRSCRPGRTRFSARPAPWLLRRGGFWQRAGASPRGECPAWAGGWVQPWL